MVARRWHTCSRVRYASIECKQFSIKRCMVIVQLIYIIPNARCSRLFLSPVHVRSRAPWLLSREQYITVVCHKTKM